MAVSSPAKGNITRRFGRQPNSSFHYGTDRGWGNGSQVYAMLAGEVVEVAFLSDYGNTIRILHGRDTLGRVIESRYCHLKTGFNLVSKGAQVAEGQQIATMGSTGSLPQGVHLHSELWVDDVRRDEISFEFTMPSSNPPPKKADPIMYRAAILTTTKAAYFNGMTYFEVTAGSPADTAWLRFPVTNNPNGISVAEAAIYKQTSDDFKASLPTGTGGFTSADRAALADKPTKAEVAQVLTVQTGDINAHTTAAVNSLSITTS